VVTLDYRSPSFAHSKPTILIPVLVFLLSCLAADALVLAYETWTSPEPQLRIGELLVAVVSCVIICLVATGAFGATLYVRRDRDLRFPIVRYTIAFAIVYTLLPAVVAHMLQAIESGSALSGLFWLYTIIAPILIARLVSPNAVILSR
jgi:hypothetical protein